MNEEHVAIVKQGREAIYQWWLTNLGLGQRLDLSRADLAGAHLYRANLSEADLSRADLAGAYLYRADLSRANLSEANLSEANLSEANLSEADLSQAILSQAILSQANLVGADLHGANLHRANLVRADLSGANLSRAELSSVDLSNGNLADTNMVSANLIGTNLSNVRLAGADLRGIKCNRACLSRAELTGAKLYGTARDDWNIEGVKCRYVFWDFEGKERSPRDRDLEPGEFERLYAQLPTIEYVFENGMNALDPLVMDRVVQAINGQNPDMNLAIDSINARGIYPTITFTLQQEEQKAAALEAVTREHEIVQARMQGQNEILTDLMYRMIDRPPANINAGIAALYGSTINIQEYIGHLEEIEQVIKNAPTETLSETAKREALDTVSGAVKDIAKNKVKEAAEAISRLGLQLGPRLASSTAFQFFKDLPL